MSSEPIVITSAPLDTALEYLRPLLRSAEHSKRIITAKCMGLINGYHTRWQKTPYFIDEVESIVQGDLYNPETNCKSRTFFIAGKLDIHATEISTGRRVIFDHKTTSEDISDPNAPYWRQLVVEGQVSHYMLLEWLNGRKVDYALWDVVKKPSISPKQVAKKDREHVTFSKTYCGINLSADQIEEFNASERETPEMYAARLAFDCSVERPQWYFQRQQIPRLDMEIAEYAKDLWANSQDMILSRRNNYHPRNSGACMLYGSPCKFLSLCSGHDSLESGNWKSREWVHPELTVLDGDGKDILTNSRIRTFQTCRRKHYYQYELGIERMNEEEREALFFGTLWHLAQEIYFMSLKSLQERN